MRFAKPFESVATSSWRAVPQASTPFERSLRTVLTMAARASAALIAELEGAADGRSPERWAKMLRQVTTLFLSSAHRFNEEQIALFDDVFLRKGLFYVSASNLGGIPGRAVLKRSWIWFRSRVRVSSRKMRTYLLSGAETKTEQTDQPVEQDRGACRTERGQIVCGIAGVCHPGATCSAARIVARSVLVECIKPSPTTPLFARRPPYARMLPGSAYRLKEPNATSILSTIIFDAFDRHATPKTNRNR